MTQTNIPLGSLQARLDPNRSDQRLYNANRDVAHCFATVAKEVAARLEDQPWPVVAAFLKDKGITEDQLGQACAAFIKYVTGAVDNPKESMNEVLVRVGWYNVPDEAQMALTAYLGTVLMGVFFVGAREATLGGQGPCSNLDDLQRAGRETSKLLATPRWKRPWLRLKARLQRARNAFKGTAR